MDQMQIKRINQRFAIKTESCPGNLRDIGRAGMVSSRTLEPREALVVSLKKNSAAWANRFSNKSAPGEASFRSSGEQ